MRRVLTALPFFFEQPQRVVRRKEMVLAGNVRDALRGVPAALSEGEARCHQEKED